MKITFDGETLHDIGDQMVVFLLELNHPIMGRLEAQETLAGAVSASEAPVVPEEPETAPAPVPDEAAEASAPEDPKPAKVSKASKPKPKPVDDTKPEDFDKARKEAISRLMVIYNKGPGYSGKVKALLKDLGVAKFSEVSDAQVPALLDRTAELEKEAA